MREIDILTKLIQRTMCPMKLRFLKTLQRYPLLPHCSLTLMLTYRVGLKHHGTIFNKLTQVKAYPDDMVIVEIIKEVFWGLEMEMKRMDLLTYRMNRLTHSSRNYIIGNYRFESEMSLNYLGLIVNDSMKEEEEIMTANRS